MGLDWLVLVGLHQTKSETRKCIKEMIEQVTFTRKNIKYSQKSFNRQ